MEITTISLEVDSTPKADCSNCPYYPELPKYQHCIPGDVCVHVESGRQIDRFFKRNPGLADIYLNDSFWERRAIAVRYAAQELLDPLIHDPDEVVRRAVAYRIPIDKLEQLLTDPDREVRITVADRLPINKLELMVEDEDYLVRCYVARRMAAGRLFRMLNDTDSQVRKIVAQRISPSSLGLLMHDSDAEVRKIVAERIDPEHAISFAHDSDWQAREASSVSISSSGVTSCIAFK